MDSFRMGWPHLKATFCILMCCLTSITCLSHSSSPLVSLKVVALRQLTDPAIAIGPHHTQLTATDKLD